MTPTTLGHYQLGEQIGQGGMGEVYRAQDTRLNRPVAVKLWRKGSEGSFLSRRLLREARAASALNHPNIVIIHEVGETADGDQYMVQEFIEGRTLRELADDRLPLGRLLDIGAQVARALAAAHAAGIVHRDIKPDNVSGPRFSGGTRTVLPALCRRCQQPARPIAVRPDASRRTAALAAAPVAKSA